VNIFEKVRRCSKSMCWEWYGELNRNGYGWYKEKGKRKMAHKVMYELTYGKVPHGLVVDHKCRNRRCCNPRHLEPVTVLENTLRGEAILFRRVGNE